MLKVTLQQALNDTMWKPSFSPLITHGNRITSEIFNPRYIILHCIGYERKKAVEILTELPGSDASAHFFIDQSGECLSLVALDKIAHHCGVSSWLGQTNLNACAIGIELHCPDYAKAISSPNNLNWYQFDRYSLPQLSILIKLLNYLKQQFSIPDENVLLHSDIAPGRKTDPGSYFPTELFAELGFGWWPTKNALTEIHSLGALQTYLKEIGYAVNPSGQWDNETFISTISLVLHCFPNEMETLQLLTNEGSISFQTTRDDPACFQLFFNLVLRCFPAVII